MELNKFDKVEGVIVTEDIVEGRFVVLTPHTFTQDFGSNEDLPGVKYPSTAEEATRAKYCLTWAVSNTPTPLMIPTPSMAYALRGGFDQAANAPFATTVYLTQPGNQEGLTIPSGYTALAFTDGIFTLPSGAYVYSSDIIVVGNLITISNTNNHTTAKGKPRYCATNAVGVIGETWGYDTTTGALTILVY